MPGQDYNFYDLDGVLVRDKATGKPFPHDIGGEPVRLSRTGEWVPYAKLPQIEENAQQVEGESLIRQFAQDTADQAEGEVDLYAPATGDPVPLYPDDAGDEPDDPEQPEPEPEGSSEPYGPEAA